MSLRNHNWLKILRFFTKKGYVIHHYRGDHIYLFFPNKPIITIPRHSPIKQGTLKAILEQAGITREEFLNKI